MIPERYATVAAGCFVLSIWSDPSKDAATLRVFEASYRSIFMSLLSRTNATYSRWKSRMDVHKYGAEVGVLFGWVSRRRERSITAIQSATALSRIGQLEGDSSSVETANLVFSGPVPDCTDTFREAQLRNRSAMLLRRDSISCTVSSNVRTGSRGSQPRVSRARESSTYQ
jgi:hypothetical protein